MAGRDITDGRSTRAIAVDLGVGTGTIWQNTSNAYDCAIAGIPFLLGINDQRPYVRETAQFRKQQFDSQRDPGEQTLTGWWLRSQSSFHSGEGINFYDPLSNPYQTSSILAAASYRYNNSLGVDPFSTQGQVTLLRRPLKTQNTTSAASISSVTVSGSDRILMQDSGKLFLTDGSTSGMTTLATGVTNIYASTDDSVNAYYVDADHIVKVALTGGATSAIRNIAVTVTSAVMGYVKQRLVVGINNSIYEIPTTGGMSLPTPLYTHPDPTWRWTSVAESGTAIYVSGYAGTHSAVVKFILDNQGVMPTLTSAITAVVVPDGETITNIHVHLMSYMIISTTKGVRIGQINGQDGNIVYGPLLIHTQIPVHGITARNGFVYVATQFTTNDEEQSYPGVYVIDLSLEITSLQFATATYVFAEDFFNAQAVDVCFLGRSNNIAFIVGSTSSSVTPTSNLGLYVQSATELYPSGWIQTGYIRYNTLEGKNFKRVIGRGDFVDGSMSIAARDTFGNLYDVISYDSVIGNPESTITQPLGSQDAMGLRFTLFRSAADISKGPTFKGYQLKALPATPRSRLITAPLLCYDTETDKYNGTIGYEGRAIERLGALEKAEAAGDIVTWQDFRTGEIQQCLIESISFTDVTPPDKKLTGFGGVITLTIRTV